MPEKKGKMTILIILIGAEKGLLGTKENTTRRGGKEILRGTPG